MLVVLIIILFACLSNDETKRAKIALDEHDLSAAEVLYRRAIQEDPRDTEAMSGLGWTYHLALQREAAAQSFERCLEVDPQNASCLRGSASVALASGDIVKAKTLLSVAQAEHPDDPEILSTVALVNLSEGNITTARDQYARLVSRFPTRTEFLLGYSEALLLNSETKKALNNTEIALQDPTLLLRYRAMFWLLRARVLLEGSAGTLQEDCQQRDQVLEWIAEAERSIEKAIETGVSMPNFAILNRQVLRRKSTVMEKCPVKTDESAN